MNDKILLIVNPIAGRGRAAKSVPQIERDFNRLGIKYDIVFTMRQWHAAELAEDAAKKGYKAVVVASGDGTANEVLNGLMLARKKGNNKTAMGQIPVGTGNDFAYGMGLSDDIDECIKVIADYTLRKIDVGFIKGGDYPQGRYFGNGIGIGFDATTGFVASRIRFLSGMLVYFIAALQTIFIYYNAPRIRLSYNDKETIMEALQISIMNGKRMGGGFHFAPNGSPFDGLLDVCMVRSMNQFKIFSMIPYFIKGTQGKRKEVLEDRTTKIAVVAEKGNLPVHCDGETICYAGKELFIQIYPAVLNFITKA